jgi:putative ABC transport system permease protein
LLGRVIRAGADEFTVVGTFERIGSVLGQDQDNFLVVPLRTYLKVHGQRNSLTLQVKAEGGEQIFDRAQDDRRYLNRCSVV